MKLYGEFTKVEPQDDGTIIVSGVASSGAVDDAGETVQPDAMKAALPDYMKFGAVREMHGLSAAGTALKTETDDAGMTNIEALIVDPLAVKKVQMGVYKGFSIGGRVLSRDPADKTIITKLKLNEISLVDRPCNPEAAIGLWKADGVDGEVSVEEPQTWAPSNDDVRARAADLAKAAGREGRANNFVTKARELLIAEHVTKEAASEGVVEGEPPVEKTVAAPDAATALADALEKAKATKGDGVKYADPKNSKYPIDTAKHIRAAWSYINMPKNQKGYDAAELKAVKDKIMAAWKDTIDSAGPPSAEKMVAVLDLAKTADVLRVLAARADSLDKGMYTVSRLAELIEQFVWMQQSLSWEAKDEGDASPLPAEAADNVAALLTLLAHMVAEESAEIVQSYADQGMDIDFDPMDGEVVEIVAMASGLVDLAKADTALMAKVGARHSKSDLQNVQAGHDAMAKLGAMCDPSNCPADDAGKAALVAENERLTKVAAEAAPFVEELSKTVATQASAIDCLTKRLEGVEALAAPAKTAVGETRAVSKVEDANPSRATVPAMGADDVAKYLAELPEQDRALLLIKASHAQPISLGNR